MITARTAHEVEALRDAWAQLPFRSIDADLDVLLTVVRMRSEVVRPHVLLLERAGRPAGMLVARLEERPFPARFGYATPFSPKLRCVTVVYGGIAGDDDAVGRLVVEVGKVLADRTADVLLFHQATVGSRAHREIVRRWSALSRERFAAPSKHRARDLPADFDALMAGLPKSTRDNLRRYERRFRREFGERAELRRFTGPNDVPAALEQLEAVSSTTYQRGLDAGFRRAEDGPLTALGLEQGWFRGWVLAIDGRPCAYEMGTQRDGVYVLGAKGYDPEFARQHVGKVVQMGVLRDLCADPDAHVLDFGFGDSEYKQRIADRGWDEVDVVVYGRTVRALAANVGRSTITGADRLARRLAGEHRVSGIKRRWRSLRTPGSSTA